MFIYLLLYHGAWAIAMVTFDLPQEIYAHKHACRQGV